MCYWSVDTSFDSCQLITTWRCNIRLQAPTLARKGEFEHWCPCDRRMDRHTVTWLPKFLGALACTHEALLKSNRNWRVICFSYQLTSLACLIYIFLDNPPIPHNKLVPFNNFRNQWPCLEKSSFNNWIIESENRFFKVWEKCFLTNKCFTLNFLKQ